MTWRTGIPLVILGLIIGTLVGVVIERAQAQPASPTGTHERVPWS